MAKLLILGGSNTQLNSVLKAKQKGHTVIVTDYLGDAPGKRFADFTEMVSTFDAEGCLAVGYKYEIDGILTVGTDQPVLTCAIVAQELGLPSLIDVDTARAVTNKKIMKAKFIKHNIATPNYTLLKENFAKKDLQGLRFPLVIKPLDSQGQRGVYKVSSVSEIQNLFDDVLGYSRESEILVEEYYESEEITLSGWVEDDTAHILTITDRVTMTSDSHIGICIAHDFPSKYLSSHFTEIRELTDKIVKHFGIHNGPIYFQMLIGREGIKVNEIACRIGGAYEDELMPLLTGIDILDMVIDNALGYKSVSLSPGIITDNKHYASVELFFAKPGTIKSMPDMEKLKELPGVLTGRFNYGPGSVIKKIENATQRIGYIIIQGTTYSEWQYNRETVYTQLEITDLEDNEMLVDVRRLI